MTLAIAVPDMPRVLIVAFAAVGSIAILAAAARSDDPWKRLFARGFALFGVWSAYFFAIRNTPSADRAPTIVFFVLMTGSLVLLLLSLRAATDDRRRFTSAALALFIARTWWDSVVALACGNVFGLGCSGGLGGARIPEGLGALMILGAVALLVMAVRQDGDGPPARMILLGFIGFLLYDAYDALRRTFSDDFFSSTRPEVFLQFAIYVAALTAWIVAARDRSRPATAIMGAGLALLLFPSAWFELDRLLSM